MPDLPNMSADDLPGLARLGEYELLEQLGAGGMGTVYKARHTELDRVVALKVLTSTGGGEDEQVIARSRREIKALGRLDHAHIVRAHDARQVGDAVPVGRRFSLRGRSV
jgi:serine/threonine-protein kinase